MAPVVLHKEVVIAHLLVEQVEVGIFPDGVPGGSELLFGIDLESLPLGTTLPPATFARGIRTETIAPAMIGA